MFVGVDLVEIGMIKKKIKEYKRSKEKIFTEEEIAH